jgi:hypothetical protein
VKNGEELIFLLRSPIGHCHSQFRKLVKTMIEFMDISGHWVLAGEPINQKKNAKS